jgi:hypothetical protein
MTAPRRRYTTKQRAEAAGIALLEGQVVASEKTGIPRTTIETWIERPEFVNLRQKSRDEVADQMWAGVQVGLAEVVKGLQGDAPLRDKSVALGILYDKHALLTGGATARSENRDISGTLSDADVLTALRYADDLARAGGSGAPQEAQGAPEGEGL